MSSNIFFSDGVLTDKRNLDLVLFQLMPELLSKQCKGVFMNCVVDDFKPGVSRSWRATVLEFSSNLPRHTCLEVSLISWLRWFICAGAQTLQDNNDRPGTGLDTNALQKRGIEV